MKYRLLFLTFTVFASTLLTKISFGSDTDIETHPESLYITDEVHEVYEGESHEPDGNKELELKARQILLEDYLYPQNEKDKRIADVLFKSLIKPKNITVTESESTIDNELAAVTQKNIKFENGDFFWIRKYDFKTTTDGFYFSSFTIPGNEIEIRYVDTETGEWVLTSNLMNKIPLATLFVKTDLYDIVLSVPGLYKKGSENHTLEIIRELEQPVLITKKDNGTFLFEFRFAQNEEAFGEIWALQSANTLVDFTDYGNYKKLLVHDLSSQRRWGGDGYYFPAPPNYVPSGENVLYRNPANYTGASFAKYGGSLLADDLGYIMTRVCLSNQNENGFWATGPKSEWLERDFLIGGYFYDTRFNSDFATSLILSYQRYYDMSFLISAIKYGEFFLDHAARNHYETTGPDGETGWLVHDYAASDGINAPTHTSLNHQLSEISFLYELYKITNEERYYDTAEKMMTGIKNTYSEWVLPDNNLRYCLHYNSDSNVMMDYPYLTYNDLYTVKNILKGFGREEPVLQYLMDCKKIWMDENGITGYFQE